MLRQDCDRIGALDLNERAAYRCDQIVPGLRLAVNQVSDNFGIGFAAHREARRLELGSQLQVVLDDAVVHDGDRAGRMGVRVDLRRATMCGPAGVPDSDRTREGMLRQRLLEVAELTDGADDLDAVLCVDGQSRRIIAPVF